MRRPSESTPRTRSRARSSAFSVCCALPPCERRGRFGELAAQVHEVRADRGVHLRGRPLGGVAAEELPRVAQLLLHLVVADVAGRFAQLLRGVLFLFRDLVGGLVELLLELAHLGREGIASLRDELRLLQPVGAGAGDLFGVVRHVGMLARQFLGLPHRVLHVALGPGRLRAAQLPLHLLQPFGGFRGLARRARIVARRRLAHRIRGLLHLGAAFADPDDFARATTSRAGGPLLPLPARARAAGRRRPLAAWPEARRRCRSSSCCCRRASSLSFSASASMRCSACALSAREAVSYWLAILSISSSNKSARSSAIEPACPPPPPPPDCWLVCTCSSYSSSACGRYWRAFCSKGHGAVGAARLQLAPGVLHLGHGQRRARRSS
jgi:hypothetical protein